MTKNPCDTHRICRNLSVDHHTLIHRTLKPAQPLTQTFPHPHTYPPGISTNMREVLRVLHLNQRDPTLLQDEIDAATQLDTRLKHPDHHTYPRWLNQLQTGITEWRTLGTLT